MQPIKKALRASSVLTTGYVVAGTLENLGGMDQLVLKGSFTIGSLTSCSIKVEFSDGDGNFHQESVGDYVAGVTTVSPNTYKFTATQPFWIPIPLSCVQSVKVSAIGVGTVTDSLLSIDALVQQNIDPVSL